MDRESKRDRKAFGRNARKTLIHGEIEDVTR